MSTTLPSRTYAHLSSGGASIAVNLGIGQGYSVRGAIAVAETISGRKVPAIAAPRRSGDPPALVADPNLAAEILG
jgi:UDP-arabinose 4-epimerase